ncbi:MAG: helix-turn-helix transcriptional regulator [Acidobacteria bacterium]|nr:helix-turn-helix transcriptional regulator [Acidobacteriota bacterium]
MGTKARPKPERLAEKLRQIRLTLGLTQMEMPKRLGAESVIRHARISDYELGLREPSLMILLSYARLAGVHMEALVDDELDLPDRLPGTTQHETIKRQYTPRRKAKR